MNGLKRFKWIQYPLLIAIAAGGIVAYNGWHMPTTSQQLVYRQFNNYERAERYLRENYDMSSKLVEDFIKPGAGNYMFFQAGLLFEKVAPFQMTFLYEGSFPVVAEHIHWHAVDDRFSLNYTNLEVYKKDKSMFLKLEGQLIFKPRPGIDLLKLEKLKEEGFVQTEAGWAKEIAYDLKLNPND